MKFLIRFFKKKKKELIIKKEMDEILMFPEPRSTQRVIINFKKAIEPTGEYFGTGMGLFILCFLMSNQSVEDKEAIGINKTEFKFIYP